MDGCLVNFLLSCPLTLASFESISVEGTKKEIKLMTYNVWSREDVAVHRRMQAISGLVATHKPDVTFFQEITPYICGIFERTAWWKEYHNLLEYPDEQATKQHDFCLLLSKPPLENFARCKFPDSPTGRGYLEADINPDPATAMKPIHVATTQLERPIPPASMHCLERQAQAKHAMESLSSVEAENVVFGGDMSWDDDTDGSFPRREGWVDAWTALKPYAFYDWTYDGVWNEEAGAFNGHVADRCSLQRRSDRVVCKLKDYRLSSVEFVGGRGLGLHRYSKYTRMSEHQYCTDISLKPSCHRGLVLTVVPV